VVCRVRPRVGSMQGTSLASDSRGSQQTSSDTTQTSSGSDSGVDPWHLVEPTNGADWRDIVDSDTRLVDEWLMQTSESESQDATQAEDVGLLDERQQMRGAEVVSATPLGGQTSESESQDATQAEDAGRLVEMQLMQESENVSAAAGQPEWESQDATQAEDVGLLDERQQMRGAEVVSATPLGGQSPLPPSVISHPPFHPCSDALT
jgi:hypothetical protein